MFSAKILQESETWAILDVHVHMEKQQTIPNRKLTKLLFYSSKIQDFHECLHFQILAFNILKYIQFQNCIYIREDISNTILT